MINCDHSTIVRHLHSMNKVKKSGKEELNMNVQKQSHITVIQSESDRARPTSAESRTLRYCSDQTSCSRNFVKYKSWRIVVRNFRQSFPDSPEPSKAMIYNLVKKFRATESVLDKKRTCVKRVLTEEMLDEIVHRLERSPTTSSRRVAQQIGVSQSSVMRVQKHGSTSLVKSNANNPHSLEEIKQNIRYKIRAISESELWRVVGHVFRRCAACQISQGHHFEHELRIRGLRSRSMLLTGQIISLLRNIMDNIIEVW
ncbi:hypothetical protein ANN_01277 [Periplaneta americana]|uniref:DUF4817 domain-containing protein n=1 Tax=Periplaneta americana TaxID=6978 RepID=A0ABQ8TUR8_PERAM|nr:hypothetical protein ANN_01277 [Periplaneta americana]